MRSFELKIPPPAVTVITALLMWLCAWVESGFTYTFSASRHFAVFFALLGLCSAVLGVVSFLRAKTTVNPMKPASTSSLVTSGIYRLTRNPMYLGLLLILLGWCIFLSNIMAFLLLPGFVWYMYGFQIAPEERALATLFGEAFSAYKASTRRWL